jgi:DNA-binding PadR family transcriptional regulator
MPDNDLNTTSYFLLALLGLGPWSAYELAEQMKRGFQYVWPRAERAFYYEAKRLAARGYARAIDDPVGERPRVMYAITDRGLEALAGWLSDRNPQPTRVESEVLGRLFFAEYGTVSDLRAAADAVIADGAAALEVVRTRSRIYQSEGTEFPRRFHMIALAGRFITDYGMMLVDYGRWIHERTAGWTDTTPGGKTDLALAIFREIEEDAIRTLESARESP